MVEYDIEIPDELKNLNLAANYIRARKKRLVPAMEKSVSAAKAVVTPLVPVGVTGAARRSIGSTVGQTPYLTIGKITSSMRRPNVYIYVLNAGRPAGKKQPPVNDLVPWVIEKGLASDPVMAKRIAFLIARSIKKKGIKGLSFMWQGLDQVKEKIEAFHQQAIDDIIQDLGENHD